MPKEEDLLELCSNKTTVGEIKDALSKIADLLSQGPSIDKIMQQIDFDDTTLKIDIAYEPVINPAIQNYINDVVSLSRDLKKYIASNNHDALELYLKHPDYQEIILPAIKVVEGGSSVFSLSQKHAQHDNGRSAGIILLKAIELEDGMEFDGAGFKTNMIDSNVVSKYEPTPDPETPEVNESSPLLPSKSRGGDERF